MASKVPSESSSMADTSSVSSDIDVGEMSSKDFSHQRQIGEDYLEITENQQVVLSAVFGGGHLGLSYYHVDSAQLHLMNDIAESEDFALLKRVLIQVEPGVVLLSSKVDKGMQAVLKSYAQTDGDDSRPPPPLCNIEILPSSDFRYDQCRRRILSLPNLPGIDKDVPDQQKLLQISSSISLDSELMVRSLGALVKYLEKRRIGMELEELSSRIPILAIKRFSLDSLMVMDESSFCALQIFQKEAHPSVYKAGGGGAKEGLSLFGIASKTKSPLGYKMLKLWFLRPLRDHMTLTRRQDAISFLSSPRNEEVSSTLHGCVKQIKNLPRILVRMSKSLATIADWKALYMTVYNGIFIGDLCRSLPDTVSIFKKASECLCEDLQRIASLIDKVIDFDESALQQRFCVKPNIDSDLDSKRTFYNGLPDLMTKVATEELDRLGYEISECSVVYFPQLGYLLALPKDEAEGNSLLFEQMDMQFVFSSNTTSHYKTVSTREMDSELGDTQYAILDHESAIMHRLQEVVLEQPSAILAIMDVAAELDCLLSLSIFAKEHNLIRPELTEDNIIYIRGGRHPLQELCASPFVPNDSCFDLEQGRVKMLTGPNASGKSVYLKQVGLIVYMSHIGSFVPAEAARIGLLDSLFTRLRTRESISLALSTFMIDMNQVSRALRLSSDRSLVILDEFGKGTATVDGLSLLVASLRQWLSRGDQCPNIIVSTHFHSIIQQKLLPDTKLIQYQTMDTLHDNNELVFLYQLVNGKTGTSYACKVAAAMGIDESIVQRGAEVTELISKNKPVARRDSPAMEEQQKRCAQIVSKFLQLDLEKDDLTKFLKETVLTSSAGVL